MRRITLSLRVFCGIVILAGSYLVAAFSNASPIIQPSFRAAGVRAPAIVVAPAGSEPDAIGPAQADTIDRGQEVQRIADEPLRAI